MLSNSICVQYCLYVNFKVLCNYLFLVSLVVSLLLLFTLCIYRCRTPWQISPGLKGLPAKN